LDKNALKGKRLGVPRNLLIKGDSPVKGEFDKALDVLRTLGADFVDPAEFPSAEELKASEHESLVLTVEFKVGVNKYIQGLCERPQNVNNLSDLI
jgi:amidase